MIAEGPLTAHEVLLVRLMAGGKTLSEMARELGASPGEAEKSVRVVLRKIAATATPIRTAWRDGDS